MQMGQSLGGLAGAAGFEQRGDGIQLSFRGIPLTGLGRRQTQGSREEAFAPSWGVALWKGCSPSTSLHAVAAVPW